MATESSTVADDGGDRTPVYVLVCFPFVSVWSSQRQREVPHPPMAAAACCRKRGGGGWRGSKVSHKLSVSKLRVVVVLACLARMCGMPTDNSYAGEMPQSDRVKGDRSSQDNAAHPPPDYSSCLPPRKGAIRRDPTYGRTIKRLTDSTKPGPGKPQSMTAEYATQNHFNADETAIFVTYSGRDAQGFNKSAVQILEASSGDLLYDLPIAINNEPMWDVSDPNVLYFHEGNALRKMVLGPEGTFTKSLIHTFVDYISISSTGESDISPDGKKIIFVGRVRARDKR